MDASRADVRPFTALGSVDFINHTVASSSWARTDHSLTRERSARATLEALETACRNADPSARGGRALTRRLREAWSHSEMRFSGAAEPSDDLNGYAVRVLGTASESGLDRATRAEIVALYEAIAPALIDADSPSATTDAMLGAAAMLRMRPGHEVSVELLERGGTLFGHLLDPARRPAFAWFEAVMGGDWDRLPQALIEAGEMLARPDWRATGRETQRWLMAQQRERPAILR